MSEDEERKPRVITTEAGSRILAKREDPYGLWVCYFERGKSPADFEGFFTSFDHLLQAVNRYLVKQGKTKIKDVETWSRPASELTEAPKQDRAA